ncbi:MAG: hypothetical protein KAH22_03430 [Thiotrichaceae bacterium]|nr:hypothetical protein [Thiotrichaceae bacterium]
MQLSNEDNLRMNVLLAQDLYAIRINEATMVVYALTEQGEAKVQLNPTSNDDQYLRWVREMIASKVTGSPAGYPIFIKRWTRMGHTNNNVEQMLLLGEPEAIVAMVHSPALTHQLAKRAWWAHPTEEVGRRLLHYPDVVAGDLGKELAEYLLEFLPFEEHPSNVVITIKLCLQGKLITSAQKEKLWRTAQRKNPYFVGFCFSKNDLPAKQSEHPCLNRIASASQALRKKGNIYANTLCELLTESGQNWLYTVQKALAKPVDQEVVIALFIALSEQVDITFAETRGVREIERAAERVEQYCDKENTECPKDLVRLLSVLEARDIALLKSILMLGQLGEDTLIPIFAGNDSVGSVMRRRLKPVTVPLLALISDLMA